MSNRGTVSDSTQIRTSVSRNFVMMALALFLSGCGSIHDPDDVASDLTTPITPAKKTTTSKEHQAARETLLGRIAAVHESASFVVIRSAAGHKRFPIGTHFEARGVDGRRTQLMFSPEQKPLFLCADYQGNPPKVGDLVFVLPAFETLSLEDATEMTIPPLPVAASD